MAPRSVCDWAQGVYCAAMYNEKLKTVSILLAIAGLTVASASAASCTKVTEVETAARSDHASSQASLSGGDSAQQVSSQADGQSAGAGDLLQAMGTGLVVLDSDGDFAQTLARAKAALERRKLKIMAEVDHAANASGIAELPPTYVLIFGNPAIGTQLMMASRSVAIDLPMKLLIWQTDDGRVQVAYNAAAYLNQRHAITKQKPEHAQLIGKMTKALAGIAADTAGKAE